MINNKLLLIFFLLSIFCMGCSLNEKSSIIKKQNQKGEYIYRVHDEYLFTPTPLSKNTPEPYPWENSLVGNYPKITKEYFRCKGSSLNPVRIVQNQKQAERYYDCGGSDKHSLPLLNQKEFIYPILIDLLNYIQAKTRKRVVVTCGHRCPEHNTYADPSPSNQFSKHMIGAEVSFYVQGLESFPEKIVELILEYYRENERYQGLKEYQEFIRYEKGDTNVSIQPWMNKEIFIKLFNKKEGRNFDNRHPYPYIAIQVRYDKDLDERVIYTWEKAHRNYLRK